jgi:mannan endo-1,4-beta-mannosidase
MVDILSFDKYQFNKQDKDFFINGARKQLDILTKVTKSKNKIAAFAETGFEAVPDSTWWTETLLPIIKDYELSYVLVWRNAGYLPSQKKMHYYAPYKGQVSEIDFKKFYRADKILFEKELGLKNIYR